MLGAAGSAPQRRYPPPQRAPRPPPAAVQQVGRRLSRAGYEIKDRQEQFQQRKAFQRLIYLSYSVFGDQKAAFLLPWRRVFNLNDSQLFVARRDNAREIFSQKLQEEHGGDLPADRRECACAWGCADACVHGMQSARRRARRNANCQQDMERAAQPPGLRC
jgi:hypothetical protein